MVPGLARMLELIETNPADTMLVDRFLVLAADTPEHERVDATLRLARSLLKRQPRRALEIAWMVYKSSLRDLESLVIISDALDGIGKTGKAEIIRSEMKRVSSDKLSDDVKKLARLTIEEHVANTLAGKDPGVFDPHDRTQSQQVPIVEFNLENSGNELSIDELPKQDPSADLDLGLSLGETQRIDALPSEWLSQDVAKRPVHESQVMQNASVARVSAAMPGAGIPEAIPPKEPSKHALGIMQGQVSLSGREEHPSSEFGSSYQRAPGKISPEEKRAQLKSLIVDEKWERVWSLLRESFADASDQSLLGLFEAHNLARLDVNFAGYWVDILIAARQERRALRFVLQKLIDEPHLAWARALYPKVQLISKALELTSCDWRESDGVSVLHDRIASLKPRLGCYLAS